MFLIFAGLILFFIASVVSFVWFMMEEGDMAKNSISYRLSCTRVKKDSASDEPINFEKNPYDKEPRKCLLCHTGVELDYKNARLLQQFVSTFTGRVYDRHITGVCDKQQNKLLEAISKSRRAGYMPIFVKDPICYPHINFREI